MQLLKSSNILLAAAANPKVSAMPMIREAADVEGTLNEALEVKILPHSYLIRVAMTSSYAPEASSIVNAVTQAFLDADAEWSDGMTRQQIANLTSYQKDLQAQVDAKRKAWTDLAAKANVVATTTPATATPAPADAPADAAQKAREAMTLDEYQKNKDQLLKTDFELTEADAWPNTLKARLVGPAHGPITREEEGAIEMSLRSDKEILTSRAKIVAAQHKVDNVGKVVRSAADPALRNALATLEAEKAQYRKIEAAKKEEMRSRILASRDHPEASGRPGSAAQSDPLQDAADRVASLKTFRASLEARLEKAEVANREDATDAVKVSLIQSDLKQLEEMMLAVSHRLEQLRFESRGQGRVSRVSEARPSNKPISDKRTKLMLLAPVALLGMLAGAFTLVEILSGRVTSTDALSARITAEVFAVPALAVDRRALNAPAAPGGVDHGLETFSNRIDHLRVAILGEADPGGPGRCIVITSATGGEGKTTLAAQFAARCADSGMRTLLIDADLRRAGLGRLLDVPEGLGLADVLKGEAEAEDVLVDLGWSGGCRFLSAGNPAKNPGRLIQGARFGEMIDRLRRAFDVILIDTSPVLPVPDALILGKKADGVILAARYDESRMPQVEHASRLVTSAGIPVLGVVLNGMRGGSMPYPDDVYHYQSTAHAAGLVSRAGAAAPAPIAEPPTTPRPRPRPRRGPPERPATTAPPASKAQ